MDQQLWTDTHSNRSNVQKFFVTTREGLLSHAANADDNDDVHHRSVSEVGFQGHPPRTPQSSSTVPYGTHNPKHSQSEHGRAHVDLPVSSSSLPLPEGDGRGTPSNAPSGTGTELRIAELRAQRATIEREDAERIETMRLAALEAQERIARMRLAETDAQIEVEMARSNATHSSRAPRPRTIRSLRLEPYEDSNKDRSTFLRFHYTTDWS